jgi:hypothetical protein
VLDAVASFGDGYPAVADIGTLDAITTGTLPKTLFTAVGYAPRCASPIPGRRSRSR